MKGLNTPSPNNKHFISSATLLIDNNTLQNAWMHTICMHSNMSTLKSLDYNVVMTFRFNNNNNNNNVWYYCEFTDLQCQVRSINDMNFIAVAAPNELLSNDRYTPNGMLRLAKTKTVVARQLPTIIYNTVRWVTISTEADLMAKWLSNAKQWQNIIEYINIATVHRIYAQIA